MINGLSEKLRSLRERYGYSQRQVAKIIGVSPSVISSYETGERTPSIDVLLSLANIYKCSTDYLLGKDNKTSVTIDAEGLTNEQIQAVQNLILTIKK